MLVPAEIFKNITGLDEKSWNNKIKLSYMVELLSSYRMVVETATGVEREQLATGCINYA